MHSIGLATSGTRVAAAATVSNIVQSRAGGRTERCHGIPHQGGYSVAAHSWGVAMLMYQLWPRDFPRLAAHCLAHDVPEAWVGDVPAPTKRYTGVAKYLQQIEDRLNRRYGLPAESDLADEDRVKLKTCDMLELYLWSREQLLLGNLFANEVRKEIQHYLEATPLPAPADEVFLEMMASELLPKQAGVMKDAC